MLNFYGNILIFTILFSSIHQILTTAQQDDPKWPQNNPGGPIVLKNASDRHFKGNGQKQRENDREREGNEVGREKQKWPQNYPGHVPETGTNSRGPFFPGHIGHWPGKSDWDEKENGQNGMEHRGGGHGKRRNEEEEKHRRNWLDRIMPWRRHRHEDREMRPHHRNHHNKMPWQHDDVYEASRDRDNDESNEDEENEMESNEADERGNNSRSRDEIDGSEKLENGTKTVVIRVGGGPVKGLVSYLAGKDRPAYVFRGIPFAEPPVGKLRFAPLKKKKPWRNQLLDATKYKAACLSNTTRTRSPQHYISEDCIYMNVFADPKCRKGKSCPVLFYVHGGGFAYDSATMFNDSQIVHKYASDGVVFLIPAYRLGVFGFLDLGEDRPVKRNLGMHDIIFALEWAHKEVHNFGGDPKRITIMGNSAGATAVSYLCASPAVKKDAFQQAIISSGVPTLTANANLIQTYALLEHFNCIVNNQTNETLSVKQRVECLRRVDSLELLREQQRNEVRGIVFSGPETDDELLPESSYAALMKHWKPLPMLKTTTKWEMHYSSDERLDLNCKEDLSLFIPEYSNATLEACIEHYKENFTTDLLFFACLWRIPVWWSFSQQPITLIYSTTSHEFGKRWGNNYLDNECHKGLVPFGYFSQSAYNACMARYNRTFDQENHMRVSYESMHAESFLTSLVNTRLGGISYVGEFELANYSNHADDLYFFFGLHYIPLNTSDVKLMDIYYPKMIKNFLYGHAPDKDWKPQNWNGRNYFRITFNVSDNGTLLEYPHNVDGYQDVKGLNFWLHDLAIVERNARQEAMEAKANQSHSDDKAWEEVFGDWKNGKNDQQNRTKERAQRDSEFLLPPSSFLALPGPLAEDGNDSMPIIDRNNETSGMDISLWILPNQSKDLLTQNYDEAKNGNELSRVWSAFWLTMTVTLLLAVSLFMLALTKAIYRYKNVRGYHPTGGGHTENGGGMFTEKTRIIHANGNNTMRYS